ncbi:MAG: hypothetical protein KC910_37775, partial [Candidatus Eremiobacteraeota bacterium]|nr:hypothetical protein [Candidatus Eremiobacteraeota bacterium]
MRTVPAEQSLDASLSVGQGKGSLVGKPDRPQPRRQMLQPGLRAGLHRGQRLLQLVTRSELTGLELEQS